MAIASKILITGGMRSGKSRFALSLANASGRPKVFLATAESFDAEMSQRIQRHRQERDPAFLTLEEPLHVGEALASVSPDSVVIIDCLSLWLNNLLFYGEGDETKVQEHVSAFVKSVKNSKVQLIVVSNETGCGTIPANELSRRYIEHLGLLNQRIAALSDQVILMTAGLPLWVKGLPLPAAGTVSYLQ